MPWNPEQYLRFADYRLRPAADLVARLDIPSPGTIFDLGCGAGNVTRLLAERWPEAKIVGIDTSPEMLCKARTVLPGAEWVQADIAGWTPDRKADLVFSNAALQWLDGHETLFPRILNLLAPEGVLAVQIPLNQKDMNHLGIVEAVRNGPWREKLEPLIPAFPVKAPEDYWDLLAGAGAAADIWETLYHHALAGENPVVEWMKGTALLPLLAALDEPWRGQFLADYGARMAKAYPRRPSGITLMGFRRLFIVARK